MGSTSNQVNVQLETGPRALRPAAAKVAGGVFFYAIDTLELFLLVRDPADIIAPAWELVSGAGGFDVKLAAVTASVGPLPTNIATADTLTGAVDGALGAVGGFTPVVGDRVLVKNEVASQNDGIYVLIQEGDGSHPYILTRADDAIQGELVSGSFIFIEKGTLATTSWILTTPDPITVGTTPQAWSQFGGGVQDSIGWKNPVVAATIAQLPAYTVSADKQTLTANANGAFPAIDGVAIPVDQAILLTVGAAAADNGIYVLHQIGDGGTPWVLQRRIDANTTGSVTQRTRVVVQLGATYAGYTFEQQTAAPITMGTTAQVWAPVSIPADVLVYVNGGTGSDSNPGTQALPFATISKAFASLPPAYSGKCQIICAAGTYNENWGTGGRIAPPTGVGPNAEPVAIVGGFTDSGLGVLTVTAVSTLAGGAGVQVTAASGLAVNVWRTSFLHILTGAAASAIRYNIRANDATSFTALINAIAGLANGDTIEIVAPNVIINSPSGLNMYGKLAMYGVQIGTGGSPQIDNQSTLYLEACRVANTIFVRNNSMLYCGGIGVGTFGRGGPQMSIGTSSDYAGSAWISGGVNAVDFAIVRGTYCGTASLTLAQCSMLDLIALDTLGGISLQRNSTSFNDPTVKGASNQVNLTDNSVLIMSNWVFPTTSVAIYCINCNGSFADLTNVTGSTAVANTIGVGIYNGGRVINVSGNSVTGTLGDLQIDGRLPVTWASQGGNIASSAGQACSQLSFSGGLAGAAGAAVGYQLLGGIPGATAGTNYSATAIRTPLAVGALVQRLRTTVLSNAAASATAFTIFKAPVATGVPASTAVTFSVSATTTGTFSDLTHTVQFQDGDQIDLQLSNTAAGAGNNLTHTSSVQLGA